MWLLHSFKAGPLGHFAAIVQCVSLMTEVILESRLSAESHVAHPWRSAHAAGFKGCIGHTEGQGRFVCCELQLPATTSARMQC